MSNNYDPPVFNLSSLSTNNFCIFAENEVKLFCCDILGVCYFGFASYANNSMIRSYVQVGRYCSIGRNVTLGLGHHDYTNVSTNPFFQMTGFGSNPIKMASDSPKRRVIVGNDVWIGDKAMIVSGVKIGDGAVIAAGAIVTKDVPPYAIVAGVPAKIIKMRFSDKLKVFPVNYTKMVTPNS